ncbi:phosphotransferase family protein [Gordonia sp. TBRC 11910]|uniref:Phosphotransferase family protein n=1 Tax=Gordonia asplenii TaxID=2725283 RepID=A0A848L752_9ACTN|nr:phosphotransferase family protein [Gordonia asplenii]
MTGESASASTDLDRGVQDVLASAGIRVTVTGTRRLTAGASRETYLIDLLDADGTVGRAVLRRDPPGRGDPARMHAEAVCLRAVSESGVRVPRVWCSGDDSPGIDAPFLIVEHVSGETLPRKLQHGPALAAVRPNLAAEFGRILARVHRTPLAGMEILDDTPALEALESTFRNLGLPNPTVELGLRWLRATPVPARPMTLVHGDFRVGNLIVDADGVQAVLDWELSHLGNPVEDLGWLCVPAWRFGGGQPVGGLGTRETLLDGYESEAGWRPSDDELRWWEIFGTLKWLVLSIFQSQRHLSGEEHSLELAAIGRRVCEFEYDLLESLGMLVDVPLPESESDSAASESPYRGPTLTEILALVSEAITDARPLLDGDLQQQYQLRIAANLLRIAEREVLAGSTAATALTDALHSVGCESEHQLAQRVQSGELDWSAAGTQRAVSSTVLLRLRVSNPGRIRYRTTS